MEPFKITCVSCRAVLTVRKESMIGQIIACPRCSMMVQVLPPAGYDSAANSPAPILSDSSIGNATKTAAVAAAAATRIFDAPDSLAETSPPSPPLANAPAAPVFAATFDDAVDAFTDPPALSKLTPSRSPAKIATPNPEPTFAEATPASATPLPAPSSLPPVASRWAALKFPAMIAGGAIAGAGIVATALTLLRGDAPAPTVEANSNVTPPVAAPASADPTTAAANLPAITPVEPPPAKPAADEATSAAAANANIDPTPDELFAEPAKDLSAGAEPTDAPLATDAREEAVAAESSASDVTDESPPAEEPAATEEAATADQPKLRIDPLEIDPEGLNLTTLYNGPPKDPIAASQLPGEQAGVELSVPAPHEAPPDAAGPPAEAPNAVGGVRRDEQAVGAPVNNVAVLLARKVPEFEIEDMPLCRLLDLSVQLSGVPVSVSSDQLRLAAVSAGQPVRADVKNGTIEEILTVALKPLRLQPVVVNDQIVLVRGGNNPRRTVTYAVDDLARDPDAMEQLVATIQQLVAPESWQAAGGAGTIAIDGEQLKIETGEAIQYEVLLLLERSRAALGLSPRSKYPAALVGAQAAPVALAQRLSAPATFTFSQYTPLREIFRHWQEEMQVAVLVDWPTLTDLRLWPNTRIACSSAEKPWDAALDEVLTPLGLAWRPIDKRTIEITTLEKAAADPLVEIYRLNSQAITGIDDLAGKLQQVAADGDGPHDSPSARIVFDAEHHLLLVRDGAAAQRRIAAWLTRQQLLATSDSSSGN